MNISYWIYKKKITKRYCKIEFEAIKKQWMLFNGAVLRKHRENEVHEKSMIYKLKLWVAQCT